MPPKSYYHQSIKGTTVDVYDVLEAFGVTCPAVQHAVKKLLRLGRGHKTKIVDLEQALWSLQRAVELEKGRVKK